MKQSQVRTFMLDITPPIVIKGLGKFKSRNAYPQFNTKYWNEEKAKHESGLVIMVDSYLASNDYKQTTKYWRFLLRRNLESIREFGVKTYGWHAARNYFTYTDFSHETIKNLNFATGKFENLNILQSHKGFSVSESIKHNLLIKLLFHSVLNNKTAVKYLKEVDSLGFTYGDHPQLESKFGLVTLDLLSSILEVEGLFNIVEEFPPPPESLGNRCRFWALG